MCIALYGRFSLNKRILISMGIPNVMTVDVLCIDGADGSVNIKRFGPHKTPTSLTIPNQEYD